MGTSGTQGRFMAMNTSGAIWLVCNAASGSNDAAALAALDTAFADNGLVIAGRTAFPDEPLPDTAFLDGRGIATVAIYAGDGTINSSIRHFAGWRGALLVLPGGTMNLLAHRLHGNRPVGPILADVAAGHVQRRRPDIISCPQGLALAGLMAGPGTSWCDVREAMRVGAVIDMAAGALKALEESIGGAMIVCRHPALGREEGYPLVMLTPERGGMRVEAYYAQSAADYLAQGWALLRRNFREGPHDDLGTVRRLVLGSTAGQDFGLLLDGEPVQSGAEVELALVSCPVDLLATAPDAQ